VLLYAADAPSPAAWLEAWATLAGAFLSAAALIVALLVLRRDQRLRREDKVESEAAQARLVFPAVTGAIGDQERGWLGVSVTVHNNSELKISALRVGAEGRFIKTSSTLRYLGEIPGDVTASADILFDASVEWPFGDAKAKQLSLEGATSMTISFIDASGLRWQRRNRREPTRGILKLSMPSLSTQLAEYLWVLPVLRWIKDRVGTARRRLVDRLDTALMRRERKQFHKKAPSEPPSSN
jgi:hypothetical protein